MISSLPPSVHCVYAPTTRSAAPSTNPHRTEFNQQFQSSTYTFTFSPQTPNYNASTQYPALQATHSLPTEQNTFNQAKLQVTPVKQSHIQLKQTIIQQRHNDHPRHPRLPHPLRPLLQRRPAPSRRQQARARRRRGIGAPTPAITKSESEPE